MIVIYNNNPYNWNNPYNPYKRLQPNKKYLVSRLWDDDIYLFGFIAKFNKNYFTTEDGEKITEIKYLNPYTITKKNIEQKDDILCINNFGDGRLIIGEEYKIFKINYYGKLRYKLELYTQNNFSSWDDYEPNMFMKYGKEAERYIKMNNIFNEINFY